MKAAVHNLEGKKIKDIELANFVFGVEKNDVLLHQVYVAQYANRRQILAHTKDRAERAGSGKKPWKQKGTGRARVGSVRSPIWRKGGVIFGPTKDRNFKKDVSKKMNHKALAVVLSEKLADKEIIIVDSLEIKESKTKKMGKALESLKIKGSVLFGFLKSEQEAKRASRNIPRVDNIDAENLNIFDILNHKYLVLSEEGVKMIEKKYKK
ncbi:MAG: ribosomal protein L4/L1e, large subunit ribosomal protein L4 [Candidatus Moranbacteria bacterium GW2011_GWC1_45_18]|nr:MAG: 50S ribosomal protein L4 [Candidatus Moranbacteria bacterium GW2011_GWC2_40_12]KKT32127.1 MAG: 50S ribosomal protein L4 [Candidatus Moranbacteria bacterium GW2011_GWF2_44_10]KKT99768.1 MAG: ribosomal protein L4/L1e, large subunit ribosomal protein L4 [Candidatus Moranbacteria bacterium GW2011_GWC1_45_18]OGI34952.1 MAG: 50S ribosomal protein L4 [Candidatus Moranbacteria bacterium RIFOXYC1_FULL_44_8]OGI39511.1 MAG: 50S ribosomal protein L4 [Candidatus Moranbacteria bacterium RIFOXYB1_FULL